MSESTLEARLREYLAEAETIEASAWEVCKQQDAEAGFRSAYAADRLNRSISLQNILTCILDGIPAKEVLADRL